MEFRCIKNEGYIICPQERYYTPNKSCICHKCKLKKAMKSICDVDINKESYEWKRGLIDYIINSIFRCQPDKIDEVKNYLVIGLLL